MEGKTRRVTVSLTLTFTLAVVALGCPAPESGRPEKTGQSTEPQRYDAPAAAAPSSEADRTQRMEEQAQGMRDQWSDVQKMEGTDAEKERAVQQLLDQQQALNREGQGEPAAPPPPE